MERVNTMHEGSGTSTGEAQVGLSPMDAQLARVVAQLAQSHPSALPAVLSALGITTASPGVSEAIPTISTSNPSTMSASPSTIAHATPTPVAPNGSYYTEGTILNATNPGRAENTQRGNLQSVSNIRAGWAAARGRRKSAFGRATPMSTSTPESKPAEVPKAVEKAVPVRLSKDHDIPLKNQPSGGLIYIPAVSILADSAPWTEQKLEALRTLCRKLDLVGYPVFTYGMAAEDVRKEVEASLPSIEFLDFEEYVWISASEDGQHLYNGPRSTAASARHLDRFYDDGGLLMVAHRWPSFDTQNEKVYKRFQREWEDILDDMNKPPTPKAATKASRSRGAARRGVAASPANAQQALRKRLPITVRSAKSGVLAPVDEEAVAAASLPAWGSLGRPLALSESSADDNEILSDSEMITRMLGPEPPVRPQTPLPGVQSGPVEASTPTPKARKTPRSKRARIECSPLFSNDRESVPRLTRNSARAGVINNAGEPEA